MKKLGLGRQELFKFKRDNLIYVDKTKIIHKLITSGEYYFLSRPRRFGKSLLVNTMEELFSGNKELFEDTWIYDNWNFEDKYPVIKISFAALDYEGLGLKTAIENELKRFEKKYNLISEKVTIKDRFSELIQVLGKEKSVVILIDEYDKPIIDYIEEKTMPKAVENRKILKNFYSAIKDCDKSIKLLFITGVSKFSKVSFFSELNNLTDITVDDKYSQITGYTEKEITDNYSDYLTQIEQKYNIDRKRVLELVKLWYDGYSWDGKNFMYNPFSVLNLLSSSDFKNYWFKSGTPTFLTKIIKKRKVDILKYDNLINIDDDILDSYEIDNIDLNVLLFQTGYLTIKEKIIEPEELSISYNLAYPNKEVRESFYKFLVSEYTSIDKTDYSDKLSNLKVNIEDNNVDEFMIGLVSLFADIPYNIFIEDSESYYHTIIYLTMRLLGAKIIPEKSTNRGRIDAVILTKKYIFVMEFKISNVKEALKQIKEKKYYQPYLNDKREIFCVGVAFDEKERNIKEYKVVPYKEL